MLLLNLADKRAEEIRKIKCKHSRHDNEKYKAHGTKYKYYAFCLEYANF